MIFLQTFELKTQFIVTFFLIFYTGFAQDLIYTDNFGGFAAFFWAPNKN